MSLVTYFKFMMLQGSSPLPLKPVMGDDKKVSHSTCNDVPMDLKAHNTLTTLLKEYNGKQNELFKQFPADYLKALAELTDEIQVTGKTPIIDLRKRGELQLIEFSDSDNDEEEYVPDPTDEAEDDEEDDDRAVSKPIKVEKKTQPRAKKEPVKPKEDPVVKVPVSDSTVSKAASDKVAAVEKAGDKPKRGGRKKAEVVKDKVPTEGTPVEPVDLAAL